VRVPLSTRLPGTGDGSAAAAPTAVGVGNYGLTYVDDDMLIGRAQATGGVFIFAKES
jgi:hypothetical protein